MSVSPLGSNFAAQHNQHDRAGPKTTLAPLEFLCTDSYVDIVILGRFCFNSQKWIIPPKILDDLEKWRRTSRCNERREHGILTDIRTSPYCGLGCKMSKEEAKPRAKRSSSAVGLRIGTVCSIRSEHFCEISREGKDK